jgi:cation:H+ antiporter
MRDAAFVAAGCETLEDAVGIHAPMLARGGDGGRPPALVGFGPVTQDELLHKPKQWSYVAAVVSLTIPALLMKAGAIHGAVVVETIFFGAAILGAAFLLSWGAEVAQLDISQGLAIAFLAFIAVLPEYAVDLVFSWKAGAEDAAAALSGSPDPCRLVESCNRQLAIANMTGANRLLIGLGWAVVVLVWWRRSGEKEVVLPEQRRLDLGFLFLATLWAITIVIRRSATVLDCVVLVGMFVYYIWHTTKEEAEHPDLIGPPLAIASLAVARRRAVTIGMFVFAAIVILLSAEPFAHGLVQTGEQFGIDRFLLVQWLAPLASEAPEMIIAILFVLRAKPQQGLGALVSSKVNQWTLLVGTVPLVYALSYGSLTHTFHLGDRQVEEVLLTTAQSLFAVAVLSSLSISRAEASMLLVLFLGQFGFPNTHVRYGFSAAYLVLFAVLLVKRTNRVNLALAVRNALSKPRARAG